MKTTTLEFIECNTVSVEKAISLNLYLVFCSSPQPSRISTLEINWPPSYRLPAKFLSFSLAWKKKASQIKRSTNQKFLISSRAICLLLCIKSRPWVWTSPLIFSIKFSGPLLLSGNWPTSNPGAQWSFSVVRR